MINHATKLCHFVSLIDLTKFWWLLGDLTQNGHRMTLSRQVKAKDSEGCCFALDETSDVTQNRTKLTAMKRLQDTCCIYTKTENEPLHFCLWLLLSCQYNFWSVTMQVRFYKTTLPWVHLWLETSRTISVSIPTVSLHLLRLQSSAEISSQSLCDKDQIFPWLSKKGKSDSRQIYPSDRLTACVIPYWFCWGNSVFSCCFAQGGQRSGHFRRADALDLMPSQQLKQFSYSLKPCCCSHCGQIRSGPQRGKALMFWACVNTTMEGQRVHMAPIIEHQSHCKSVV